jgi:uncharacterized repeat protein (TIGR01451 family)
MHGIELKVRASARAGDASAAAEGPANQGGRKPRGDHVMLMNPFACRPVWKRAVRLSVARVAVPCGLVLVASVVGLLPTGAAAQAVAAAPPQPAVAVELAQLKVVPGADGKEQFLPASSVKPGDVVEYRATYRNRSGQAVSGLVATLPIPDGLQYVPVSARSPGVAAEAAAADGVYGTEPLQRRVRRPDGATAVEPVPSAEYRSLRWRLGPLAAGAAAVVQARAQVVPLAGASPSAAAATPATASTTTPAAPAR